VDYKNLSTYTGNLSILYIEDELIVSAPIESILKDFFLEVHCAQDAEQALKFYDKYYLQYNKYYNLLLVDIGLPNMNGIELSRLVLEINPLQQIIIISAYREKDKLQDLISLGIDSFIPKPINIKNFFEVIKKNVMIIVKENFETSTSHDYENNKILKLYESLKNDYAALEKEHLLCKENFNEKILLLTQTNILKEKNISDLLHKIESLNSQLLKLEQSI